MSGILFFIVETEYIAKVYIFLLNQFLPPDFTKYKYSLTEIKLTMR